MSQPQLLDSTDRYYAAVRLIAECKVNAWMMGGVGPYIGEAFWRWLAAELAGNIEDVLAAMEQIQKEPTFFPNSEVQAQFAQIDFDEADPITQLLDGWAQEYQWPQTSENDQEDVSVQGRLHGDQTEAGAKSARYLAIAYCREDDYAVSDTLRLDPSVIGTTPSDDRGAAEHVAAHLRHNRSISWIDRIWLIDTETAQVVGDYDGRHFCEHSPDIG